MSSTIASSKKSFGNESTLYEVGLVFIQRDLDYMMISETNFISITEQFGRFFEYDTF